MEKVRDNNFHNVPTVYSIAKGELQRALVEAQNEYNNVSNEYDTAYTNYLIAEKNLYIVEQNEELSDEDDEEAEAELDRTQRIVEAIEARKIVALGDLEQAKEDLKNVNNLRSKYLKYKNKYLSLKRMHGV
jgi:hypothetical protein